MWPGPEAEHSGPCQIVYSEKGSHMKVKVIRIAAALGVVTALATAAVPAASAAKNLGGTVSPPWATYCIDDFGSCAPTPGPVAL